MRREIDEIPEAVGRLVAGFSADAKKIGDVLQARDPGFVVTIARGSSDHAAAFLKYAIELKAGRPVASIGPSIASIYHAPLVLDNALCLAISQSGRSPDIVAMQDAAEKGGALTVSLTNVAGSPLALGSSHAVDMRAGSEIGVAATKTYVNSIVAGLMILAAWTRDDGLKQALERLPEQLKQAVALDWSPLAQDVEDEPSLFILGRGPALAIAHEAALKFKETCNQHAEAYSAAEVLHGPVSMVGSGFPVLGLAVRDEAEASVIDTADELAAGGAAVHVTSRGVKKAHQLKFVDTGHALTDALALIVPFYGFVEKLARDRGLDPDQPVRLKKVTETV
jgi:glucosamine--fructose-6-phosphate aminotransferase (isomerizing)